MLAKDKYWSRDVLLFSSEKVALLQWQRRDNGNVQSNVNSRILVDTRDHIRNLDMWVQIQFMNTICTKLFIGVIVPFLKNCR